TSIIFAVLVVGFLLFCWFKLGPSKKDRAKLDCKNLEQLITSYFAKHDKYPENLEALAQTHSNGSPPLVSEKGLIDPWGRPYHYDPQKLHPKTERPLIWSDGPNPGEDGSKISNWD